MFVDVFVMALVRGTIGTVHDEDGPGIYHEKLEVQPALRARLTSILGDTEADTITSRFGW